MGYLRDLPDFRDCNADSAGVRKILARSPRLNSARKAALASVDLRAWCSTIEDQNGLGSCTAHAGVAMLEHYQRRAFGLTVYSSIPASGDGWLPYDYVLKGLANDFWALVQAEFVDTELFK